MNITVNEKAMLLEPNSSIEQLFISLDKPLKGSALAVNQKVINRSKWAEYKLCEGDKISLFQAIAGG